MKQRVRNVGGSKNLDGRTDRFERVHAGAENNGLAHPGDVTNKRIIVALAGPDLYGRHVEALEAFGGRP